jgi:hypothetical protein
MLAASHQKERWGRRAYWWLLLAESSSGRGRRSGYCFLGSLARALTRREQAVQGRRCCSAQIPVRAPDSRSDRAARAHKLYADLSLGEAERLPAVRPLGVKRDVVARPVAEPPRAQDSSPERGPRLAAGSIPEPSPARAISHEVTESGSGRANQNSPCIDVAERDMELQLADSSCVLAVRLRGSTAVPNGQLTG